MTLTVVVGSSGSGKTTFLNDVHKSHHCTYIRQYHNVRPYVTVSKIPNFDETKLPYWEIYENEGKAKTIMVGGTMAGEFTAGLSGGQRKLMLFELICQRMATQSDRLVVFDEPFAGVTDDFVPWVTERLLELKNSHNVLLVTNDHVEILTKMADNTITVSAIDRTKVAVNGQKVDRDKAILALAVGGEYRHQASSADFKFFLEAEIYNNGAIIGVGAFTVFAFSFFLATFWDSADTSGALVIVAASIIAFFCLNPYLLALVDWRNFMSEEAEALLHASKGMNKALKSLLTLTLILVVSLVEWGVVNAVVDGFEDRKFWVAILMDSASLTFPFIFFGLYTKLPFQAVQIFASLPFLFMIFFSTTFSPGSGVPGLKELRYLFARFYFWCMLPGVQDNMENCPDEHVNIVYMILSAMIGVSMFLVYQVVRKLVSVARAEKKEVKSRALKDDAFVDLQIELYGSEVLLKDSLAGTNHSKRSRSSSQNDADDLDEVDV